MATSSLEQCFRSARGQLLGLWLLIAASAAITGYLLVQFYWQTTARQVSEADEVAARACRTIGDRYRFYTAGWSANAGPVEGATLQRELGAVVATALAHIPGVEGGIWQGTTGSLAYAYPTYEGTGPKTDLPAAELPAIRQINGEALASDAAVRHRTVGRAQTVVLNACPLPGPLPQLSAWTMTRVYSWSGPAYSRLVAGMSLLGFTVVAAASWLALVIVGWSRRAARVTADLDRGTALDLPRLAATGDPDMDRLVAAFNAAGERLGEARRRAEAAERLAAVGRLSAGLAHEVRNPIAAIRLKAENALASRDPARATAALDSVLQQVARLDRLLTDLLAMTHQQAVRPVAADVAALLAQAAEANGDVALSRKVSLQVCPLAGQLSFVCDPGQLRRALDNLVLNAIQATPAGGGVRLSARHADGAIVLRVEDDGPGVDPAVRDHLFEPFVTGRAEGTGLGLAIVREIARAHGGSVRLATSARGSAFEMELPCKEC